MFVLFTLCLFVYQLLIGYEHNYLEIWDSMTWKPLSIYGPMKASVPSILVVYSWIPGLQYTLVNVSGL